LLLSATPRVSSAFVPLKKKLPVPNLKIDVLIVTFVLFTVKPLVLLSTNSFPCSKSTLLGK
jgi:hypothetical protein